MAKMILIILLFRIMKKLAAESLIKASRAKKHADFYQAEAFRRLKSLENYAALLGLDYQTGDLTELQNAAVENEKKRKAAEKIRKAEKMAEQAEALEKWRAGENIYRNFEITALRINGENIETTKGAKIPVDHAIKAWPLLKRLHNSGQEYIAGEHSIKLGYYTVSRLTRDNLIVGCHTIPFAEVQNIAAKLNLN